MARALAVMMAVTSFAGCRCSVENPTPVTLKVKNPGGTPIFVDDTSGVLGLTVQRQIGSEWFSFTDKPCSCLACETVCTTRCACEPATAKVRKIAAGGGEAVRTWDGIVRIDSFASCGQGCLSAENAAPDEKLRVQLCYVNQVNGFRENPDGGSSAAMFPKTGQICNEKEFRPQDGLVEISPKRGADCITSADCKGTDELCFGGACTPSCPANDVPELGGTWQLYIPEPDDQGFFAVAHAADRVTYTGTGTLSSVLYQAGTIVLRLQRAGTQGETLNGTVYLKLPAGIAPPLVVGTAVSVSVIDASSDSNPENRALVIRDAQNGLMLAADTAQQGSILSNTATTPFAVSFDTTPFGCRVTPCGRQLYYPTRFTGPSSVSVLEPGKSGPHVTPQGTYKLLNVASYDYASTSCSPGQVRSWAVWREML